MIEKQKKTRRLKGGFFTVYMGLSYMWITENYSLYRDNGKHSVSLMDDESLYKDRKSFIEAADIFDFDDCRYVVQFTAKVSNEVKRAVISAFHNGLTRTMRFDD